MPKMAEKWDCDVVHKTIKLNSALGNWLIGKIFPNSSSDTLLITYLTSYLINTSFNVV